MTAQQQSYMTGVIYVLMAEFGWSLSGIFVRLMPGLDGWQVLARLRETMATIDPLRPGDRVDVGTQSPEVAALAGAFNEMLDRLEGERRHSSRRAQAAQEQERRALSLELHDEIGQVLTGLQFELAAARIRGEEALTVAEATVQALTEQVRQLSMDLRPPMLDTLGLLLALQWLIDRFQNQIGHFHVTSLRRNVSQLYRSSDRRLRPARPYGKLCLRLGGIVLHLNLCQTAGDANLFVQLFDQLRVPGARQNGNGQAAGVFRFLDDQITVLGEAKGGADLALRHEVQNLHALWRGAE